MRVSERRTCKALAPSADSIAVYPSSPRTSATSMRTEGSSSTIRTVSPAPARGANEKSVESLGGLFLLKVPGQEK